jgi:glutamate racemase
MKNRPIGIFDSGIGGLTVANAIQHRLPAESFVYFGDTAHIPYGDKSPELIRHYVARITAYLLEQKVKMVVIACNTASSHAYQTVVDLCGPGIKVINVIDPVVNLVVAKYKSGKVGVIGTKGTIASRVYPRRIKRANSKLKVVSQATPLLAPMIEEGFFNNRISKTVIESYLSKPMFDDLDALILGCTHYPLIKREVKAYFGKQTDVIDSASVVARSVEETLQQQGLLCNELSDPDYRFLVSDHTESFERSTRLFFKKRIHLSEVRLVE